MYGDIGSVGLVRVEVELGFCHWVAVVYRYCCCHCMGVLVVVFNRVKGRQCKEESGRVLASVGCSLLGPILRWERGWLFCAWADFKGNGSDQIWEGRVDF